MAADGTVLVTDLYLNHIVRFDSNGSLLGTWAVPGDYVGFRSDNSVIGANWSYTAQFFEGQVDWVVWQPVAGYSGAEDLPH